MGNEQFAKVDIISESELQVRGKILKAIRNKNYKARTVKGIANESNLTPEVVIERIKSDSSLRNMIKVYPRRTQKGNILITTKERFAAEASAKDKFVDIFSTHRFGIDDVR